MSRPPSAVMVFAAGFGTRMRPLTDDRPKPLVNVAGQALLDHALALAERANVARIVVNAHYRAAQIEAHLAGRSVDVIVEEPEILDTGGGLKAARPLLVPDGAGGPVFTLNTDAVWTGPNPLAALRAAWRPEIMDALLLLIPADRALGHRGPGDFTRDDHGRLTRGPGHVYSGAQILHTGLLDAEHERAFSLNRVWDRAARSGRLYGAVHEGGWCDVGRPEGIADAEGMLRNATHGAA